MNKPNCSNHPKDAAKRLATKTDIANTKAVLNRAKWQIILAVGGIVAVVTLIERWLGW